MTPRTRDTDDRPVIRLELSWGVRAWVLRAISAPVAAGLVALTVGPPLTIPVAVLVAVTVATFPHLLVVAGLLLVAASAGVASDPDLARTALAVVLLHLLLVLVRLTSVCRPRALIEGAVLRAALVRLAAGQLVCQALVLLVVLVADAIPRTTWPGLVALVVLALAVVVALWLGGRADPPATGKARKPGSHCSAVRGPLE